MCAWCSDPGMQVNLLVAFRNLASNLHAKEQIVRWHCHATHACTRPHAHARTHMLARTRTHANVRVHIMLRPTHLTDDSPHQGQITRFLTFHVASCHLIVLFPFRSVFPPHPL